MKRLFAVPVLLLLTMLVGCGVSSPTEADAKQAIQKHISDGGYKIYKIAEIHKTNGQTGIRDGVPTYKYEFEGEVEFTEYCYWNGGDWLPVPRAVRARLLLGPTRPDENIVRMGERRKVSGYVDFEKTEKGWRYYQAGGLSFLKT